MPHYPTSLEERILKELTIPGSSQTTVRESYTDLAKRLGVNKETVRLAMKRAANEKFILKWRMLLNPHVISQEFAGLQLEAKLDPEKKAHAISQIELIEGVAIVFNYHGTALRIVFYYESDQALQRKLQLIASICGCKEDEIIWWRVNAPKSYLKLRKTDWQILKAISTNPRRPTNEIASDIRVSSRTINRRISKMIEDNVMYLIPVRNVKNALGILCSYLIRCEDSSKREIDGLLKSEEQHKIDFALQNAKGFSLVSLLLNNVSEAEQFQGKFRKVKGVKQVYMNMLNDFIFVDSWLEEILQRNANP